jgi:uncharacterized protein involved in exopolysaccharide biosynthesis
MVELLDTARPSRFKDWPPRKLWLATGFAAGLAFGILWTALEAFFSVFTHDPRKRARFEALASGKIADSAIR